MTWASDTYSEMRTAFGAVEIRHNARLYQATKAQPGGTSTDTAGFVMDVATTGAIRLLASELKKPYPAANDQIDVRNILTGVWEPMTCLDVEAQHSGETLLIQYGSRD